MTSDPKSSETDPREAETFMAEPEDDFYREHPFPDESTRTDLPHPGSRGFQADSTRQDLALPAREPARGFNVADTQNDLQRPGGEEPPTRKAQRPSSAEHELPQPKPQPPAEPPLESSFEDARDGIDDSLGGRYIDGYLLEERLGAGGMGDVFLARRKEDGVQVALKVLTSLIDDETTRRRFDREGQVLTNLDHPTIVGLVGRGFDKETRRPYLAMELVPGRDLKQIVDEREGHRLTHAEAIYVLERVAKALLVAHEKHVIHRDVKPSNVLVTPRGEVKLTDFGIALSEDASMRLTMGALVGTPTYLAPEVLLGEPWSPAADAYAFGSLGFEVLSGRPLFEGDDTTSILVDQITTAPADLGGLRADAPAWLTELIMALLRKEPEDRPSLASVAEELAAHLPLPEELEQLRRDAALDRETQPLQLSGGRMLKQGQVFHRFRIDEELGRGGMGVVFRAMHLELKKPVALKVLASGALASELDQQRFLREAQAAGALSHSTIVPVLDAGAYDGTYYLAMELVEGRPLGDAWCHATPSSPSGKEEAPLLSREQFLQLFSELCGGVAHAHARGVIHRDLKPDNVLVDAEGHPHVLDFGVAKRTDERDEVDDGLTTGEHVVGTLRYMAPEQASGDSHLVDVRSDVWSLGVILYEGLCGQTPFRGNVQSLLRQLHFAEVPHPTSIDESIPWELEAICLKALEREPDDRYQSALELAREVERYLAGEPIRARKATLLYRARKYVQRNRAKVGAALAVTLTLLVILSGWAISTIQSRRELAEAEQRRRQAELQREREQRDAIRLKVGEGWRAYARASFPEAAASFEAARTLTAPDQLIAPTPEDLAQIPPEATPNLGEAERSELRYTRDRLRRWTQLARQRERRSRIDVRLTAARRALSRGELEQATREVVAASELGGRAEARPISEAIATAFVRRAQALLKEGLSAEDLRQRRLRLEEARKQLEDAQRVVARVAQAELGQVLRELGKLSELEQAQAVERARRQRAQELVEQGAVLLQSGDFEEARRAYEVALGNDARNVAAREGLLDAERGLREREQEQKRQAQEARAIALRREANQLFLEGRERHGLGELPEVVRASYFESLERLRRSALLADLPETQGLTREVSREFASVLVDQGQAALARFVRKMAGLPEEEPNPAPLPRDPHLSVIEGVAASARGAYGSAVVFQPTRAFDALRGYIASQARTIGKKLRFELRILGVVTRKGLHPQIFFTGIEIRMYDETRNTVSAPRRVMAPARYLRPAAVDTRGRRLIRPFKHAQRLDPRPIIREVEKIVQAMVRDG